MKAKAYFKIVELNLSNYVPKTLKLKPIIIFFQIISILMFDFTKQIP